jgi:hypothetical protein
MWRQENQGSAEGVDDDLANPLSRSVQQLIEEGKPIKRLSLCYCTEVDGIPADTNSAVLYWMGVFILSAAGRILFFPGFAVTADHLLSYKGTKIVHDDVFNVDHLTIEKNFKSWHITSLKSKKHVGNFKTLNLDHRLFLWFGLSFSNMSVLRRVKKDTVISVKAPSSDSKRRIDNFMKSREGAIFQIVKFHPEARSYSKDGFFHIVFIISTKGAPDYRGNEFAFPYGSPFLSQPVPKELKKIPTRSHRVSLSPETDIQIIAMRLPGSLTSPIVLTGQSK